MKHLNINRFSGLRRLYNLAKAKIYRVKLKELIQNPPLKLVVGAGKIFPEGWIPTDYDNLDVISPESWAALFTPNSIEMVLSEHVWEHLTLEQGTKALENIAKYLKKGGHVRIAVPDGYHSDPEYIEHVRPGGSGAGAADHKVLYTYKTLSNSMKEAGLKPQLIEYFDEKKKFYANPLDESKGFVHRSLKNDSRNADGKPNYTSLIIDGIKS